MVFSNHSLHRTSTTRLFQAGVDRKIIKEFTGHASDAVDKYQVTSEAQKQEMSKIIGGAKSELKAIEPTKEISPSLEVIVKDSQMKTTGPCVTAVSQAPHAVNP